MAPSDSFLASSSSSSSSSSSFLITQEQFNLFHSIDRELYGRLVVQLGRDPAKSMQVMALWLWLEEAGHEHHLVHRMLSLPNNLISALADEAMVCLNCVEYDEFPLSLDGNYIPLIQSLTKSDISLKFFHGNRLGVLRSVTKIVNEVCVRAFHDIMQKVIENKHYFIGSSGSISGVESTVGQTVNSLLPNDGVVSVNDSRIREGQNFGPGVYYNPIHCVPFYGTRFGTLTNIGTDGTISASKFVPNMGVMDPKMMNEASANAAEMLLGFDTYDLASQRQILNVELTELLSHIEVTGTEEEKGVPPDDRTIFLTFSKGYPITENEVREFFTRRIGDCIDAMYMQEVQPEEQVLYARLVVHTPSMIDTVLGGQTKAKFSINGKHVWARKYVRKLSRSPPRAPTPTLSQPTSPAATAKP